MSGYRNRYHLRAFEWIGFLLYGVATCAFFLSVVQLLFGDPSNASPALNKLGVTPNFTNEASYGQLEIMVGIFLGFMVLVYVRNYIVMHRIDTRRDQFLNAQDQLEPRHKIYSFVDFNIRAAYRTERFFRAAIVLWVLTSTIGAFSFVNELINYVVKLLIVSIKSQTYYLDVTMIEGFAGYYGFVVIILFGLFVLWDMTNLISMGQVARQEELARCLSGNSDEFMEVAKAYEDEIPKKFHQNSAVYSIIAYIRPKKPAGENPESMQKANRAKAWSQETYTRISKGEFLKIYILSSCKFRERLAGLFIGFLLFATPLFGESLHILQTFAFILAMTKYLYYLDFKNIFKDTLFTTIRFLFGYLFFAPSSFEPASDRDLVKSEGDS